MDGRGSGERQDRRWTGSGDRRELTNARVFGRQSPERRYRLHFGEGKLAGPEEDAKVYVFSDDAAARAGEDPAAFCRSNVSR
jgi:hypothetical protein